jgi:NitT/TauT family transport system substrate-binding protein
MKRVADILTVVSLLVLVAFDHAHAEERQKVSVQMALEPAGTTAGLFLPEAKGWYKEAGLDVDIHDGRGSMASIQLVAAGQIDFGTGGLGAMAVAKGKGAPLISVMGLSRRTDLSVLVDEKSSIRSAGDLRGKKLLLFATSPWVPFLDSFLRHSGLKRSDASIVFLDAAAFTAAYAAGEGDAIMTIGPYAKPLIDRKRPSRVIDAADYGVSSPGTGLFLREELLRKSPELVAKFVKLQSRAWNYILEGHEDEAVAAIIAARPNAKLDAQLLKAQIEAYRPYFETVNTKGKPLGWQSEADWAETIKSMVEAGLLKPGYKPADFFTNRFLE